MSLVLVANLSLRINYYLCIVIEIFSILVVHLLRIECYPYSVIVLLCVWVSNLLWIERIIMHYRELMSEQWEQEQPENL